MKIASKLSLVALFLASLTGCTYFQFPGVHKIFVQQGHIITQDMIDQLEPGMTKRQVRYVLGTPLLADGFNEDRWDYHYSLRRGDNTLRTRHMTVYFEDGQMTRFTGDAIQTDIDPDEERDDTPPVPSNIEGDPLPTPGEASPGPVEDDIPLPTNTL